MDPGLIFEEHLTKQVVSILVFYYKENSEGRI